MKRHVIMFQPRFAPLVESGAKPTTIRGVRKRPIKEGDELILREWLGKPYRSKQRTLRTTVCTKVEIFGMEEREVYPSNCYVMFRVGDSAMVGTYRDKIAQIDGFSDATDMIGWFRSTHSLPFTGVRIHWK